MKLEHIVLSMPTYSATAKHSNK